MMGSHIFGNRILRRLPKKLAIEKIVPVAAISLRPVAATVANLPSIHYFVTHFAEMVTRPLTSPVQPR